LTTPSPSIKAHAQVTDRELRSQSRVLDFARSSRAQFQPRFVIGFAETRETQSKRSAIAKSRVWLAFQKPPCVAPRKRLQIQEPPHAHL